MAGGGATGGTVQSETYREARTLLLLPAWVTLGLLTLAPLMIIFDRPDSAGSFSQFYQCHANVIYQRDKHLADVVFLSIGLAEYWCLALVL